MRCRGVDFVSRCRCAVIMTAFRYRLGLPVGRVDAVKDALWGASRFHVLRSYRTQVLGLLRNLPGRRLSEEQQWRVQDG